MDTKEAIEFCKDEIIYRHWNSPDITQKIFNEFEEKKQIVIDLLQQGEKYENIVKDLYGLHNPIIIREVNKLHRKHFLEQYKYSDMEASQDYKEMEK